MFGNLNNLNSLGGLGTGRGQVSGNPIPSTLPKLWFDASTLLLSDNTPVDTWVDQSGNGYNATATLTARPLLKTSVLNGKNVVRFDGINDFMTCGNAYAWGTSMSFVVVFKFITTTTAFQQIISKSDGGFGGLELRQNVTNDVIQWTNSTFSLTSGAGNFTSFGIHVVTFLNQSPWTGQIFKNGATNLGSNNWSAPGASNSSQSILLGARVVASPALFANMDLAEIIVYDRVITTQERDSIENYLGLKYGITVT